MNIMVNKRAIDTELEILEVGNIYFIYRPKVDQESVALINDVQRFYANTAEVIDKLRMRKTQHPLAPLLEGTLE